MTRIASPHNARLKALRRLHEKRERARSGTFLAEGEDLVLAAERAGWPALEGYRLAGSGIGGEHFHDVERAALDAASALGSGTRVIGVYAQRWSEPAGPLCVYLHGVGDPGNVGTIIRSAHAFGAASVALGEGCADPYSPKAVRASMGSIFAVPLARAHVQGRALAAELPGEAIALDARAAEPLGDVAVRADGAVTLLVGSERDGLPGELLYACTQRARIPVATDSLNAAMAATVALYEIARASAKRAAAPGAGANRVRGS